MHPWRCWSCFPLLVLLRAWRRSGGLPSARARRSSGSRGGCRWTPMRRRTVHVKPSAVSSRFSSVGRRRPWHELFVRRRCLRRSVAPCSRSPHLAEWDPSVLVHGARRVELHVRELGAQLARGRQNPRSPPTPVRRPRAITTAGRPGVPSLCRRGRPDRSERCLRRRQAEGGRLVAVPRAWVRRLAHASGGETALATAAGSELRAAGANAPGSNDRR